MFADYGTSQALSCPWGNMLDHRKGVDDDMRKRNDNAGRHTIQSSKRKNVQLVRRLKITQLGETLFEPCTQPLCIPEFGKHVFYATPSVGVIFGHLARALPLRHIKKHFHSFTAFFLFFILYFFCPWSESNLVLQKAFYSPLPKGSSIQICWVLRHLYDVHVWFFFKD